MKTLILLGCLIPFVSFAATTKDDTLIVAYQQLCAKEQDPVKRHNYCQLLEKNGQMNPSFNVFRKDTAIA